MKLLKLKINNFMGIREFILEPSGRNVSVYGDNGKGKTSLFSAFTWLFFGKDSQGKTDFEIKTLDENGNVISGIDHEVEATFDIGGKTMVIGKVYREIYTKKRGSATAEFTGHSTDYFIDGVPLPKKQFDSRIFTIVDESLLRMLTDPDFFPGKMEWKDRRRMLMEVCGDVSDGEVIASDTRLSSLDLILQGRSVDDHRKVLAAKKPRLNDEIQAIPIRVDEATKALPIIACDNPAALPESIEEARTELQTTEAALLSVDTGSVVAEKKLRAQQLRTEILTAENRAASLTNEARQAKARELMQLQVQRQGKEMEKRTAQERMAELKTVIDLGESDLQKKREEWLKANSEQFTPIEGDNVCPTCGQSLPEEQIAAARESAQAEFNRAKSEKLGRIDAEGKRLKTTLEARKEEFKKLDTAKLDEEISAINATLESMQAEIDKEAAKVKPASPELTALQKLLANIEAEIAAAEQDTAPEKQRLTEQVNLNRIIVAKLEQEAAKVKQREDGLKRIDELKARQKELAKEYQQLDKDTFLTEEFIRTKVRMIETKINSRFKYARFRLFETQINGAINEVCEVLGPDLVPYSKGLNNAARINTGLDIVNTLSEHYGFEAPVFVDNAEAVTQLIETRGQLIRLVVSEPDKTLRVEAD